MFDYDIIVVGGGPGGYVAGSYASQFGKKTAVVEKGLLGGCCLNVGCIPTKTILEAANRYVYAKESADYGVNNSSIEFSWKSLKTYSEKVREELRNGVEGLLRSKNCSVILGEAELIDRHTIKVGNMSITADSIILAIGSHPSMPQKCWTMNNVITSDTFWDLEKQPKSIVIVGGGVIGCEIASALSRLETKVTIVEQMPRILSEFGEDATRLLFAEFKEFDVDIFCNEIVSDIFEGKGDISVKVGDRIINSEYILWSTGRVANDIKCNDVDLKRSNHGFIEVDEHYRTSVDNIYSIGDANGRCMLAHVAMSQAMQVVKSICTDDDGFTVTVPQTVFTSPSIATLGSTEYEDRNVAIGKVPYSAVGYSHVVGHSNGYFKVIRDIETDTLLGAEIVGYNACELIHNLAPYINKKLEVGMFSDIMYAHPTLSEGIKLAVEASYIRSPQV